MNIADFHKHESLIMEKDSTRKEFLDLTEDVANLFKASDAKERLLIREMIRVGWILKDISISTGFE